jgi:hypothetical protein
MGGPGLGVGIGSGPGGAGCGSRGGVLMVVSSSVVTIVAPSCSTLGRRFNSATYSGSRERALAGRARHGLRARHHTIDNQCTSGQDVPDFGRRARRAC